MHKYILLIALFSLASCFDQSKYWDSAQLIESINQNQLAIDQHFKEIKKLDKKDDGYNQLLNAQLNAIYELDKIARKDYKKLIKIVEKQNPQTLIVDIIMLATLIILCVFLLIMTSIIIKNKGK
jgi:hypothetical protein